LAPPTLGDDPAGLMDLGADASTPDTLAQAMAAVPQALRSLGLPVQSAAATAAMTNMLRLRPFPSPMNAFATAISSPKSMTSSGTSAGMPTKIPGSPQLAVSLAVGRGVLVGRLSVPRSWGDAAFGSLRSIA
jgi:hypothetical protein